MDEPVHGKKFKLAFMTIVDPDQPVHGIMYKLTFMSSVDRGQPVHRKRYKLTFVTSVDPSSVRSISTLFTCYLHKRVRKFLSTCVDSDKTEQIAMVF